MPPKCSSPENSTKRVRTIKRLRNFQICKERESSNEEDCLRVAQLRAARVQTVHLFYYSLHPIVGSYRQTRDKANHLTYLD